MSVLSLCSASLLKTVQFSQSNCKLFLRKQNLHNIFRFLITYSWWFCRHKWREIEEKNARKNRCKKHKINNSIFHLSCIRFVNVVKMLWLNSTTTTTTLESFHRILFSILLFWKNLKHVYFSVEISNAFENSFIFHNI